MLIKEIQTNVDTILQTLKSHPRKVQQEEMRLNQSVDDGYGSSIPTIRAAEHRDGQTSLPNVR